MICSEIGDSALTSSSNTSTAIESLPSSSRYTQRPLGQDEPRRPRARRQRERRPGLGRQHARADVERVLRHRAGAKVQTKTTCRLGWIPTACAPTPAAKLSIGSRPPFEVTARTATRPARGSAARTYLPVSSSVAPCGCAPPIAARPTGVNAPFFALIENDAACPVVSSTAMSDSRSTERRREDGARPADTVPRRERPGRGVEVEERELAAGKADVDERAAVRVCGRTGARRGRGRRRVAAARGSGAPERDQRPDHPDPPGERHVAQDTSDPRIYGAAGPSARRWRLRLSARRSGSSRPHLGSKFAAARRLRSTGRASRVPRYGAGRGVASPGAFADGGTTSSAVRAKQVALRSNRFASNCGHWMRLHRVGANTPWSDWFQVSTILKSEYEQASPARRLTSAGRPAPSHTTRSEVAQSSSYAAYAASARCRRPVAYSPACSSPAGRPRRTTNARRSEPGLRRTGLCSDDASTPAAWALNVLERSASRVSARPVSQRVYARVSPFARGPRYPAVTNGTRAAGAEGAATRCFEPFCSYVISVPAIPE